MFPLKPHIIIKQKPQKVAQNKEELGNMCLTSSGSYFFDKLYQCFENPKNKRKDDEFLTLLKSLQR